MPEGDTETALNVLGWHTNGIKDVRRKGIIGRTGTARGHHDALVNLLQTL